MSQKKRKEPFTGGKISLWKFKQLFCFLLPSVNRCLYSGGFCEKGSRVYTCSDCVGGTRDSCSVIVNRIVKKRGYCSATGMCIRNRKVFPNHPDCTKHQWYMETSTLHSTTLYLLILPILLCVLYSLNFNI